MIFGSDSWHMCAIWALQEFVNISCDHVLICCCRYNMIGQLLPRSKKLFYLTGNSNYELSDAR
jgi:hypothetical protein